MTEAATRGLQWQPSPISGDGHSRLSGPDYAPADGDERGAGTEMADGMAATFDRLREAAAAHDTSELNDIATLS
jgi:hypothetical protein